MRLVANVDTEVRVVAFGNDLAVLHDDHAPGDAAIGLAIEGRVDQPVHGRLLRGRKLCGGVAVARGPGLVVEVRRTDAIGYQRQMLRIVESSSRGQLHAAQHIAPHDDARGHGRGVRHLHDPPLLVDVGLEGAGRRQDALLDQLPRLAA